MKEYLKKLHPQLIPLAQQAAALSAASGAPAYLVGGCVRDLILGAKNCDLDITVEGDGLAFARELGAKLNAQITEHPRFGTAVLALPGSLKIDVASTRKERYPQAASLPVVSAGTLEEDLARRDFTINAMALRLEESGGQIIDPFSGLKDLACAKVRVLHDLSFQDDPTRILRALRFASRFNFKIEPHTLGLLKKSLAAGYLNKVNPHRLRDEFILALKEERPFELLKKLGSTAALSFIRRDFKLSPQSGILFNRAAKEAAWFETNLVSRRLLDRWLIYLGVLLEPLGAQGAAQVMRRLGMRKGEEKRVVDFLRLRAKIIRALKKPQPPPRLFSLLEPLSYETIILLDVFSRSKIFKKNLVEFFSAYHGTRICICGQDLARMGLEPGPQYQKIFARVLKAKLNGQAGTHQAEIDLVKRLLKNQKKRSV